MKNKTGIVFLHEGTFPDGFAMAFRLRMYIEMLKTDKFELQVLVPRKSNQSIHSDNYKLRTLWNAPLPKNIFIRKISYYVQDIKWLIQLFKYKSEFD